MATAALHKPRMRKKVEDPLASVQTVADLVKRLGDIPPERIRFHPLPGTATEEDAMRVSCNRDHLLCELIDGILVERAMGTREARCSRRSTWCITPGSTSTNPGSPGYRPGRGRHDAPVAGTHPHSRRRVHLLGQAAAGRASAESRSDHCPRSRRRGAERGQHGPRDRSETRRSVSRGHSACLGDRPQNALGRRLHVAYRMPPHWPKR